jgi:hypothetical protein
MFKTYKDKLVEIEVYYNDHDFETTIVEASRLTEKALHVHAAKAVELEREAAFKFSVGYALLGQNENERAAKVISEAEHERPEDYMDPSEFLTAGLYYQYLKNEPRAKELLQKAARHRDATGAQKYFKDRAREILATGSAN